MELANSPQTSHQHTVLVVDDEPSNVQMLVDILNDEYRVIVATDGDQAIKLLARDSNIDVMLLDVHMPGLNGFDVLNEARSHPQHSNLPIIMVTAHNESSEEAYALEHGATDFLSKPVSAARVKARIKHQLTLSQSTEMIRIKNAALEDALQAVNDAKSELSDFMAMVSHELRTPIAILQCETELLVDGVREANPDNLGSLLEETKHISDLISDMFDLVLSETNTLQYKMAELELATIIQHSCSLFQNKFAEKELALKFNAPQDLNSTINGDQKRLRQVIDNLLENSLKYTARGGKVEVTLSNRDAHIVVKVSDSAPGISLKEMPKVFDKFYRVEKSRNRAKGGSGLGLAICKSIIETHQGEIDAFESPLGGLSIQFAIPQLS